jgi:hypothetical protein
MYWDKGQIGERSVKTLKALLQRDCSDLAIALPRAETGEKAVNFLKNARNLHKLKV